MGSRKIIITLGYILFLIVCLAIFYKTNKKMIAVFSAIGAAVYSVILRRFT